jgi:hypothetical protein
MKELAFTREQYAARIARSRKDLPPGDALAAGEAACGERDAKGGHWPIRVILPSKRTTKRSSLARMRRASDPRIASAS